MEDTTSLIGINESGKSNLLVPLWKLNPAKEGEITPISDYPRSLYNDIKRSRKKPKFIEAYFELPEDLIQKISNITGYPKEQLKTVSYSKDFNKQTSIDFPSAEIKEHIETKDIKNILEQCKKNISKTNSTTSNEEQTLKNHMEKTIQDAITRFNNSSLKKNELEELIGIVEHLSLDAADSKSFIKPQYLKLIDALKDILSDNFKSPPNSFREVEECIHKNMPKFIYYSNYGTLDSEIYLPHVIQNLKREDLSPKEKAKARTLKVLFDFVNVKPEEILGLGVDPQDPELNQIEELSEKKRERDVLLQSASTKLTKKFKDWWKQGDYRFRFAADGNHFRIWVSDDKRPEDIELEERSTGLQWFLSFFLVFLVEAKDSHEDTILLLDEPGLTLHPLAQKDLSDFFENLNRTNQIIYTTHSPFLVDSSKLNRVRAVYLDAEGNTVVSSDLRISAKKSVREKSIYAAHAALGLTISDVILQGCQPIIVEGFSDQIYLSMMKIVLIRRGFIKPYQELAFIPGGGVRSIKKIASIVSGRNDELPFVILDSDDEGTNLAKNLGEELYTGDLKKKLISLGDLCENKANIEIEDLLPRNLIVSMFSRMCRGSEVDFENVVKNNEPLVPQMKKFLREIEEDSRIDWKVELAKKIRQKIELYPQKAIEENETLDKWKKLFERFGVG